jgi:hypothetical protein
MGKLIGIAAIIIAMSSLSAAEPVAPHEAETLANRVVELLSKGDPRSVARLMHYPAAYTEKQREKDMTEVETLMSLLLRRFGTPSAAKHEIRPVAFFEMGGGGGDLPYWQSLSPFQTYDVFYSAQFSRLGTGVIKVRVFRHPSVSKPEVQWVGFGLPVTRADAKSQIISMTKEMMRLQGMTLPPNIDEILEQNIKPGGRQT